MIYQLWIKDKFHKENAKVPGTIVFSTQSIVFNDPTDILHFWSFYTNVPEIDGYSLEMSAFMSVCILSATPPEWVC